jgi:hypothetical protein
MQERPSDDLTGKKFRPWISAMSANDGLAQAIDVSPCCHPNHAFLPAFRTFHGKLHNLS